MYKSAIISNYLVKSIYSMFRDYIYSPNIHLIPGLFNRNTV